MKIIIYISEEEYKECKSKFDMISQEGYINYNLNTALIMHVALGKPIEESEDNE